MCNLDSTDFEEALSSNKSSTIIPKDEDETCFSTIKLVGIVEFVFQDLQTPVNISCLITVQYYLV